MQCRERKMLGTFPSIIGASMPLKTLMKTMESIESTISLHESGGQGNVSN